MNIALSLIFSLLVAGMSTPTTAQGLRELLSALNVDVTFLPRHADYISLLEPKDVVQSFRESCKNNEALERFKESLINFVPSAKFFQKLTNRTIIVHPSISTSQVNLVVTEVCPRVPTMLNATRNLINSYNNCLKPSIGYSNVATADSGVPLSLLEYVCEDNGSRVFEIIEDSSSLNCVKNAAPGIATCVVNSLERDHYIDESHAQFAFNILMSADLSQQECRLIESAHVCVIAHLNDCGSDGISTLADSVMRIIKRQTPCQKWFKNHPEKSPASETPPLTVHPTPPSLGEKIAIPEDPRGWFILLIRSQEEVVANLKEDCEKYAATNDLETNVAGFILDLISIATRLLSVPISKEDSMMDKQMIIFVREFCYSAPYLTYSMKKLLKSHKNCLGPNKRDDVNAEGGVLVALIEHACKNNGSELLGVLQDENSVCAMPAVQSFDRCVNRSPTRFSYAKENPLQLLKHILTSDLQEEDCQFVSNIRSCIDESTRRCDENHMVKEITLGIIQIIDKHVTSCKN